MTLEAMRYQIAQQGFFFESNMVYSVNKLVIKMLHITSFKICRQFLKGL